MASVWLESPSVNSRPLRLFISKGGRRRVLAAILVGDDGCFYLAYSREVAGVLRELVLPSPLLDPSRSRLLVFKCGGRCVRARGYAIKARSRHELDLLTEEVRYLIAAAIDVPVKVREVEGVQSKPPVEAGEERVYEAVVAATPVDSGEGERGRRHRGVQADTTGS